MNQMNQPLKRRLRHAAVDRTIVDAERVGNFVIDADGVIDLRESDKDPAGASITDPAKALRSLRGRLGDAAEVSNLYDESELPKPRWRLGLRARHTFGATGTSVPTTAATTTATIVEESVETPRPQLSKVPISMEMAPPLVDCTTTDDESEPAGEADTGVYEAGADEPTIQLDNIAQTAECPRCAAPGQRDLFDRFNQVEFFSCNNCMHMWQQNAS
ncbi:MAG: hypothetical protein ACI9C1_003232 [Candidatus Aldehydirespiratoraceae bacterium]|jgi:hypothetical protein